jgi:hypothetical protein
METRGFSLWLIFLAFVPVLLAVASSPPVLSQCDSNSLEIHGGGGWAYGGGGYFAITGKPYTAIFHSRNDIKLPNRPLEVYEEDTKRVRDSSGRTYRELTAGGLVNGEKKTVLYASVLDPVCGVLVEWNTDSKVATVTHLVW